ncbi:MAG: hypothetical protein ACE5OQ_00865 [Woeseia sp.]
MGVGRKEVPIAGGLSNNDCSGSPRRTRIRLTLKSLTVFDYLVLAGALVNLGVIGGIVGFWLAAQ